MPKRSSSELGSSTDGPSDNPPLNFALHSDEDVKPAKNAKRPWSAEEEAVFLELMERLCMSALWHEIKLDKRLAHRGQPGIRAHILAMFKRLKK
ncbi:hypothetical protein DB88DRAFT_275101 [Papiliotrema laurentii]|uniref:Myb-like domain-containing protein n=1 Tax=Papiliotrema laurentii TaxID=5418 RepID=A0AAD9D134_PAPLA|nr:hypothetical protein DB88DRAFT_275101 [Papiliotrema laurentii]